MKTTEVFVCYNDFNMSCSGIVTLSSSIVTGHSSISCSGIITGDSSLSSIASYDSSRSFIGLAWLLMIPAHLAVVFCRLWS